MILYLDSSSIVALHLEEPTRHTLLLRLRREADAIATSRLSYAEARAAFALARREPASQPRLTGRSYERAIRGLDTDWPSFIRIDATESLVRGAGQLAEQHDLKGYDAVQLVSAIELSGWSLGPVLFSTWDRALARAAGAEGLALAREVPG